MFKLGVLPYPVRFTLPSRRTRITVAVMLAMLVECIIVSVAVDRLLGDRTLLAHVVDSFVAVVVVAQMLLATRGLVKEEERIDTYVEV